MPIRRWWPASALVLAGLAAQACASHRVAPTPPRTTTRPVTFIATAYCHGATTAAGVRVREGVVAADPSVLPLGTVVRIDSAGRYDGPYMVLDTGPKVVGRHIDLFIRDCREAVRFGRRSVRVSVVRRETDSRR
jgi:3D (Asp-Asp-Asp) domain-containing protein